MHFLKKFSIAAFLCLLGCAPNMQNCILACSPDVPKKVPAATGNDDKVANDGGTEVFDPAVDILFLVDDSGSMEIKQQNLITNINRFISAFTQRANIDYHIGVVTTTFDNFSSNTAPCCGHLVGNPYFVSPATPNLTSVLATNFHVGTTGSGTEHV